MKTIMLFLGLLIFGKMAFGQSDKDVINNKIKAITTWQNDQEDGLSQAYKDSFESFDKNGNSILKIKYKKDGSVKSRETRRYDKNQNKVEEYQYDENGEVVLHKMYGYNMSQKKTEEKEYSASGELIRKTTIAYNLAGDKLSETVIDSKGNILKKEEYKHNSRGLKTERATTGKTNQLELAKKWAYEYY